MQVLRSHRDGKPRVYRMKLTDAEGDTFTGIVKSEREPEAWWSEFSAYYTQAVGGFLAPVIGHITGGNYVRGLPVLEACEPDCPIGRDVFGDGVGFYAPAPGLCPIVMKDCGPTLAERRLYLTSSEKLDVAGKLVDALRRMEARKLYVTDLKLENICMTEFGAIVFIDPGSLASGKAVPVTSVVVLSNWLREPIRLIPGLEAALASFAVEHPVATHDNCITAPVGAFVGLSAKLAISQLLDFSDAALVYFQSIDHIFSTATNLIRVCVGDRATDYRDFTHFFCSAGHLVE